MINPKYVKIGDKKYKINTSFKIALKCNNVIQDNNISDYERLLAVIYLLFGDEGLADSDNYDKLAELSFKYLMCGQEPEDTDEEKDMDFNQDYNLIRASFRSDYGIDIEKEDMDWWDFYTHLNGLSEGCILNRIRDLRTCDLSDITNEKTKNRIKKAKKKFALKQEEPMMSKKQKESADKFYKLTGIKRR